MKIAILDLDITQAKAMCEVLEREHHQCHAFTSLSEFAKQFFHDPYDVLVVSLHSSEDERKIVQEIRAKITTPFPILSITGSHDEEKIVATLAAGANDYLLRPVRRGELATRVSVLLRQAYPTQTVGEQIQFGPYLFETHKERITIAGKPVNVTKKEFELALLFFRNLGRPLSRATIEEMVWRESPVDVSRTVDTHISRVRNKLDLSPERGYRLSPVYGYGYRLDAVMAPDHPAGR